jgi:protein-S-isoprenylcysteine O-methyltransferase Ste14
MDSESVFRIGFWTLLAGVLVMRGFFAAQVRRAGERLLPDEAAVQREGRLAFAIRFLSFFVLIGILIAYAVNPPWIRALSIPLPAWLRWAGLALGLLSLALWVWTQQALGAQWSAQLQLRQDHQLITTGPYTHVRHPLYTAMVGWAVGLALVTANWIFVGLAALSAAVFFVRVPREEQMMLERFGDDYRSYMQRTGRVLPR